MTARAFVAVGSNMNDPSTQVRRAFQAMTTLPESRLEATAPLYGNDALGPGPQPAFINSVAEIDTALGPHALLDALQATESEMGRKRDGPHWGPRIIDLDLLMYADLEICDQRLVLPHPEICRRRFVLLPLADLAPDLVIPGLGPISSVLAHAPPHEMRQVSPGDYSLKAG